MQKLHQLIQRYYTEQARNPKDWGYVGDLGYIYRKLREMNPEE
jgi:hypothetical protein